ncbi:protealysin inhibitor emfourin [Desulfomonile tiedjei]|uniref:Uncharacterized protein n=1 Tax=Desulfomonile tiedjei (strain ATCC 49306 / DSM 6799 / DCB-1) TaxID=706587 RepID=I4CA42_DESTA|nr:protealysin inhibitor emfourin [Desulfomonile tiedjei]AFM26433.1 hypothetical protein Desti_3791 [Desulfomonile tiedjei DSM 6799]
MKIRFRQTGGFANLIQSCEIDTKTLSPARAAEIENLVRNSGILTVKIPFWRKVARWQRIVACDLFYYSISIESSEVTFSLAFDDSSIPDGSRPLLNYLKNRVRSQPR